MKGSNREGAAVEGEGVDAGGSEQLCRFSQVFEQGGLHPGEWGIATVKKAEAAVGASEDELCWQRSARDGARRTCAPPSASGARTERQGRASGPARLYHLDAPSEALSAVVRADTCTESENGSGANRPVATK